MAILQKTYRALVCEECMKKLTDFTEVSSYELRRQRKTKPYGQKDYCKKCHPGRKRKQQETRV